MRAAALTLALLCSFFANTASAGPLNQADRDRAIAELNLSRKQFLDSIANLSQAQWTFKAGPDRWSIAEVAEHIIAAEDFLGGMVTKQMMALPADEAKAAQRAPANQKMDEGFLAGLRDRSNKVSAPGEIVPKGIYKSPAEAAEAFQAKRAKTLDYVRTTRDALRDHFTKPFPGFEMDGVQGLLMIAGHNERHVLQIEEVKQAPNYPKQ
jgi:hypothetical protein